MKIINYFWIISESRILNLVELFSNFIPSNTVWGFFSLSISTIFYPCITFIFLIICFNFLLDCQSSISGRIWDQGKIALAQEWQEIINSIGLHHLLRILCFGGKQDQILSFCKYLFCYCLTLSTVNICQFLKKFKKYLYSIVISILCNQK